MPEFTLTKSFQKVLELGKAFPGGFYVRRPRTYGKPAVSPTMFLALI
jgi:hypothetical protein